MDAIWSQIIQGGLALAVLALAVRYLLSVIDKKEVENETLKKEVKALTDERREAEIESLIVISKIAGYMEKGEKSFNDLKTFINDKIDSLKK